MGWYLLKLALLLPLLAGMIWGSLWLAKRLNGRLARPGTVRGARLVETVMLSPGVKLAVIEFHGREILVGCTRGGLTRLAEAAARHEAVTLPPVPVTEAAR